MTDVYIAMGHGRRPDGTFDPGATDGTHTEQRDSKPVAEACTRVLRNAGLEVISESDQADDPNFYGTTARANEAGVKCVVSFHFDWNQAPPGAFAIATTDDGRKLGRAIEARVEKAGFAIRDYPDDRDGLYLLDNSHAPAVIFECGRIGHGDIDEPDEQRAMGEAAARGILDWLGINQEEDMEISPQSDRNTIRIAQAALGTPATGEWDADLRQAIITQLGPNTNDPDVDEGNVIRGLSFHEMLEIIARRANAGRTWTRKQIAAIAAGAAAGGATVAEVVDEIVRRLGG